MNRACISAYSALTTRGGWGVPGLKFAENAPLASQSPYPIIVYSVGNYRPHLSHFWANTNFYVLNHYLSPAVQTCWYVCLP